MNKMLKGVLENIKPSQQEKKEHKHKIYSFMARLSKGLKAKVILGGSGAKDTWLRGACDADIFVQFSRNKNLSDILEKHIRKAFPRYQRLHGSRDYFQVKEKNFLFEIIPILKITRADQAQNITDISPLHSEWVNRFPDVKNDIRLTKAFCKANNIYGAESYIQGFSGYICEILTIYYGSFKKLVSRAPRWKDKEVLDPEKFYKNKRQILFELNKAKQAGPLVIIDPVQKSRNAAAAVGYDKFNKFKRLCQDFNKNPSQSFFEKREIDTKKKYTIEVVPKKGKTDVVGSKILKAFQHVSKALEPFGILDSGWQWNKKCIFWFDLEKKKLSKTEIKEGPPLYAKEHVARFKKKYAKHFTKHQRLFAEVERQKCKPKEIVEELSKSRYIKQKVRGIRWKGYLNRQ
jgi:tRNA nucleotidyltransferase (CCA-adding enzyme)